MHTIRGNLRRARRATLMGHTARGCLRPRRVERATQPAPPTPEELRRQAEIERELLLARDIQQGLLLEAVPQLPGWEISAVSTPARDLGGDLYDFLPLGDGWHGVMIGDVSGKGLPAALRMAVARTVFRHEARRGEPPGATLAAVNRGIISEIPQGMVTMLYAVLDTHRGLIRMANAGHTYPVLLNGCIEELELSGLPLGVDTDSDYDETTAIIRPGTTVLLYTDGVIEAGSPSEEYFGYDRLAALLADHANQRPRALVAALLHELRGWSGGSQSDDITVVVLRRRLEHLDAELRSVADDVLGAERAAQLWEQIDAMPDVEGDGWGSRIPELVRLAQTRFGRGLARELNAQLRLTVEEYR